jgi:hypothetical protein
MQEPDTGDDPTGLDNSLEPGNHAEHTEPSEKPGEASKNGLDDGQTADASTDAAQEVPAAVGTQHQILADSNPSSSIPDRTREGAASSAQKQNEQAIRKSAIAAAMEAVKYAAPGQRERVINEAISAAVNPSSVPTETVAVPQRSSKHATP